MLNIPARRICQVFSAALANSYWPSLATKMIYQGPLKGFCAPLLNCYACPLALFACPIGTIQHFVGYGAYHISLYTIGILGGVGSAIGKMPCGWICPFGFFQELLFKIRTRKFSLPRWTTYGKYAVLGILVFIIPFLTKEPWFCKLCSAGGLEGAIPMLLLDGSLWQLLGALFALKMVILGLFLVAMVFIKRPFCRIACPLGAIFSFFNRISIFRLSVNQQKCIQCDKCYRVCPMDIKVYENPNDKECIRCLECKRVCDVGAISYEFAGFPRKKEMGVIENV
jgi:polyferredoxin